MESRLAGVDESYEPVTIDDEDSFVPGPAGYLSLGEVEDPSYVAAEAEEADLYHSGLTRALASLDERSRDIVEARWLQEEKTSLKALAEKYGVSLERIRQIEAKAFKTMQPFLDTEAAA